jgi:hypothetical protein
LHFEKEILKLLIGFAMLGRWSVCISASSMTHTTWLLSEGDPIMEDEIVGAYMVYR